MFNFSKPILHVSADSPEKERMDPANWGYGLKSYFALFEGSQPVQIIGSNNFWFEDNNLINQLPPNSVIALHDTVFRDAQQTIPLLWNKNILYLSHIHIDLHHPFVADPQGMFPPIIELSLIYADYILVFSDWWRDYILKKYGEYVTKETKEKIIKITPYRPNNIFYPKTIANRSEVIKTLLGIDEVGDDTKLVIMVGRMEMLQKNAILFDNIAERFWEDGIRNFIFVKIGGGREKMARRKNLFHIDKMAPQELAKVYSIADLMISPSWVEPFGFAILEYLMCGGEHILITPETGIYHENKTEFEEECVINPENIKYDDIKQRILNYTKLKVNREEIVSKYTNKNKILAEYEEVIRLPKSNAGNRFQERIFNIQKQSDVILFPRLSDLRGENVMYSEEVGVWKVKTERIISENPQETTITFEILSDFHINEMAFCVQRLMPHYKIETMSTEPIPENQFSMIIKMKITKR